MPEIKVERNLSRERQEELGVSEWPIWKKEASEFHWTYYIEETCYLLEGEATVTPLNGGEPVRFGAGDLVVFPPDLACVWNITKPVRKHYHLD
ncbi:cupin domain-containing protein [Pontiella sp.]|uniref:cupin domain-containing protein n=1 Tax=Pontiella sp. TaxID=2837462 RepID=UPI00356284DA